jgi:peroxiredoxin (alkyl hydroperoxide reductase subunit C)
MLGEIAPAFKAETSRGVINFPDDYKGKWVILFSHPADFTPVCTTEFITFAKMQEDFKELNTELIGLSIDGVHSHIAWVRTIEEKIEFKGMKNVKIEFPIIADLTMDVSKKYGMLQPNVSNNQAIRAVFFIDPRGIIRAMLYYPMSLGRNFDEIKRMLIGLQTSDRFGVATPADWKPGDDVIIPPPSSTEIAEKRMQGMEEGSYCLDWFLCMKKLPVEEIQKTPATSAK